MRVKGKNSELVHKGERYHIQTESWELEEGVLVSQVFQSGKLVLKKRHKDQKDKFNEQDVERAHEEAIKDLKALLI